MKIQPFFVIFHFTSEKYAHRMTTSFDLIFKLFDIQDYGGKCNV